MNFVVDLPQTLSELKNTRAMLVSVGQEHSASVSYLDELLLDIEEGRARPAPEKNKE